MRTSRARHALAVCDDCSDVVPYGKLKPQGDRPTIRVCRRCYDLPMPKERRLPPPFAPLAHPRPGAMPGGEKEPFGG